MKKISVLIVLILILTLTACGNAVSDPDVMVIADATTPGITAPGNKHIDDIVAGQYVPEQLTMSEYKELNIFLSNFAETQLHSFGNITDTDDASQAAITIFAIEHVFLNSRQSVTTITPPQNSLNKFCEGDDRRGVYSVSAATIDSVLAKYVGSDQKGGINEDYGGGCGDYFYYENGKYYFSTIDDRSILFWAQTTSVTNNGDGTYTVSADNYLRRQDEEGNLLDFPQNRYEPKENWGEHSDMKPYSTCKAVLIKENWNGGEVWQLVSYALG
jgi:hypothetical protein